MLLQIFLGLRPTEAVIRQVRDLDDGGRVLWVPFGKTENARRRLQVPTPLSELEAGATAQQVASALGHARFSTTAKHYADVSTVANMDLRRVASALGSQPERAQLEPSVAYLKETLSRSDLQELGRMLGFIVDRGTT